VFRGGIILTVQGTNMADVQRARMIVSGEIVRRSHINKRSARQTEDADDDHYKEDLSYPPVVCNILLLTRVCGWLPVAV